MVESGFVVTELVVLEDGDPVHRSNGAHDILADLLAERNTLEAGQYRRWLVRYAILQSAYCRVAGYPGRLTGNVADHPLTSITLVIVPLDRDGLDQTGSGTDQGEYRGQSDHRAEVVL